MFVIFYSKQNIGMLYMLSYIIITIKEKKGYKNLIIKFLIAGALLAVALISMFYNGNLENFISYAVLGLGEFGRYNAVYNILPTVIIIMATVICISKMIKKNEILNQEETRKVEQLIIFAMILEISHYPIIDIHHLMLSGFLLMILVLYYFVKTLEVKKKENLKIDKIATIVAIITICCNVAIGLEQNIVYIKMFDRENNIYYGAVYKDGLKEKIDKICDYIIEKQKEGIPVKVVSFKSMLYMNKLNINNGDLDI